MGNQYKLQDASRAREANKRAEKFKQALIDAKLQIVLFGFDFKPELHPVLRFDAAKSAVEKELANTGLRFNLSPELDLILIHVNGDNIPVEPTIREALRKYALLATDTKDPFGKALAESRKDLGLK